MGSGEALRDDTMTRSMGKERKGWDEERWLTTVVEWEIGTMARKSVDQSINLTDTAQTEARHVSSISCIYFKSGLT